MTAGFPAADRFLAEAEAWFAAEVAPHAGAMDRDPALLARALAGLAERGWLALRRPAEYGGPALAESAFRGFQEAVARTSGALAFLQTQHQSAVSLLARSDNADLKARTLPRMHDGTVGMAIGFSQLRRPGPPPLRAERVAGGYRLDGHLPWITGKGFFAEVLAAGQLPDGTAVFGVLPFADADSGDGGTIRLGPEMALAAMGSARTVAADVVAWRLRDEEVAFTRPPGWIHTNDRLNITLQGFFAVGCAQGSIDEIRRAAGRAGEAATLAADRLQAELAACREGLHRAGTEADPAERLALRAHAIDLAVRCAHAAVAAVGGGANGIDSPVGRRYREALVYTVSAQTPAVRDATLDHLAQHRATRVPAER